MLLTLKWIFMNVCSHASCAGLTTQVLLCIVAHFVETMRCLTRTPLPILQRMCLVVWCEGIKFICTVCMSRPIIECEHSWHTLLRAWHTWLHKGACHCNCYHTIMSTHHLMQCLDIQACSCHPYLGHVIYQLPSWISALVVYIQHGHIVTIHFWSNALHVLSQCYFCLVENDD